MRGANYVVVQDSIDRLVIRDLGPWDKYLTVTNAVEDVVRELAGQLKGRRLFYYDTEGQMDELVVKDGQFAEFAPGDK